MPALHNVRKIACACLFAALLVSIAGTALTGCGSSSQGNRAYLEELEQRSVDDAQKLIYERADEKKRAALEEAASDGFVEAEANRKIFGDCVLIGDSVSYMAYEAGYLTEDEICGYYSVSLKTCDNYVDKAIALRPSRIVFNFGTNDMVLFGGDAGDFAETYLEQCEKIKAELPYCEIYIASTLSPNAEALEDNPGMVYADAFNAAVSEMCGKTDRVTYVDTSALVDEHADLRGDDGIHFKDDFYGYWFAVVDKAIYA